MTFSSLRLKSSNLVPVILPPAMKIALRSSNPIAHGIRMLVKLDRLMAWPSEPSKGWIVDKDVSKTSTLSDEESATKPPKIYI